MKKAILTIVMMIMLSLSLTSCETTYAATCDPVATEVVDYSVVVRFGTPYYYEGAIIYYLYNNLYYYPFWYNGHHYMRPYPRPFAHGMRPHFGRPDHRDFRYNPRPYHHNHRTWRHDPRPVIRPNGYIGRPDRRSPSISPRQGRPNNGAGMRTGQPGRFGGRR